MTANIFRSAGGYFVPILLLLISLPVSELSARAGSGETLLVLGDSISAAYGIDERQGWVQLLREKLDQRETPVAVVNASVSGETSSGGLARLPRLLEEHQPDWLIVELGGNDGLRGYPPPALRRNLQQMVKLAKQQGAAVLILGMRMPPNYGKAYGDAFAGVYPKVAEAEQVALVPFFLQTVALQEGGMQADGIHPTVQAQPALLAHVWPCILGLVEGGKAEASDKATKTDSECSF